MITLAAEELVSPKLQCLDIGTFLSMRFPARQYMLAPIIPCRGLSMLYAPRGIGKTYLGLSMGHAVASGGKVMRWSATEPRRVLYVDGEMKAGDLQERLTQIVQGSATEIVDHSYFQILAADNQERGLPDLSSKEGQEALELHLEGVELLILDNLSTLCRTGKENEGESWLPVQQWLLELRRRGIGVLLIHHAGKGGNQRGTSRREDVLDTVIALRRSPDYEPEQGARFEIHLEKARGISGEDASPLSAQLILENNTLSWSWQPLVDDRALAVEQMIRDGMTVRDIAEEIGMSKSAVQRLKSKLAIERHFHGSSSPN